MTLRQKTLILIAVIFIVLIAVLYFVSRAILLDNYLRLEERLVQQNVERVRSALINELSGMESVTDDWAAWDDTYQFVEDRNEE